ncbi:hypothetical protein PENDEC_c008G02845 [Penicillium decumbens]|uniref:Uncharacterized protein n=1 Tax=Penicillium decumbens TaxID=69771 RepID=A0A1V6PEM7_PENDC|nr:hypothetical protein PENDEC_c008G02845 [Penicillium decumbens]
MGHKVSVVHGVKSDNFYEQGNAINEIWVDDVEVISRLPFGDSDLEQASWSENWPKIPWHQFIIPLKREVNTVIDIVMADNTTCTPAPQAIDYLLTTGPLSLVRELDEITAYFLGLLIMFIGAVIYCDIFGNMYLTWANILKLQRLPVQTIILRDQHRLEMDLYKRWIISFGKMFFAWIILSVGMFFMVRGTMRMSAGFFIVWHLGLIGIAITISSFLFSIYTCVRLKRIFAARRQQLDEGKGLDTVPPAYAPNEQELEVEQVPALVGMCPSCNQRLLVLRKSSGLDV